MGLLDGIFKRGSKEENDGQSKDQESAKQIMGETAVNVIKQMSGKDNIIKSKKLIDNVIVFTGASGGTGVSTLVSNVATMASKKGLNVVLIDLNIMYPIQHSFFELKQESNKNDLVSMVLGHAKIGDCIEVSDRVSLIVANNRGLMDYINCESSLAVNNMTVALDKLKQLYDLVLIDCPMSVEHTLINSVLYNCDQVYMVWDESMSSIANAERIRRNMAFSGIESYTKVKAVLNKRTSIHYSNYAFTKLNLDLVQVLPFESDIIDSGLRSTVFCKNGESSSKNASIFYNGIESLTRQVMENGGYIG